MDVVVRTSNNPVNDTTVHMCGLIDDLDKAIKTKSSRSPLIFLIVVDCQS